MLRLKSIPIPFLIACLVGLLAAIPVWAVPPLPSSFYGTVKVNGDNVPDGTLVRTLIDGQVYAQGHTQTYQGDSVYSLDVPGDDTGTAARDGGYEGETIEFEIGGVLADQTGTWHSGTNVELNLTASAAGPLNAVQATPSPVPTQTPILPAQPSLTPTTLAQLSPTPLLTKNSEENTSNIAGLIVALVVVMALAAGGAAWAVRRRR
jgi:hypothetical protein